MKKALEGEGGGAMQPLSYMVLDFKGAIIVPRVQQDLSTRPLPSLPSHVH